MHAIPTLMTDRLILTGHTLEDFADSAAMWADPAVTRHVGGRPSTAEEVWSRLMRYAGHWAYMGYGYWLVRERQGRRFVGEVGFADWRREIDPPFYGAPEAGWVLASWAHGQGYAGEAVAAIAAWGDTHFSDPRTVCMIDPQNAPSLKLAAKAGFQEYARTTYHDAPTVLLERMRPAT
jgi:RimJ/RimL family protein N-acetyltransferase